MTVKDYPDGNPPNRGFLCRAFSHTAKEQEVNAVMHDALAISERLKQAGLPESAAKAVAVEIVSTVEERAATKADVREIVRSEMAGMRSEMAGMRSEMSDFRKEIHEEIMELRKDMRHFMVITLGAMTLLLALFGILMKVVH